MPPVLDGFSGVYHADGNSMDVEKFTVDPSGAFSFTLNVPEMGLTSVFTGTAQEDTASGIAKYELGGESGELQFTAKRTND